SKDETPSVLKTFIIGLENLLSLKNYNKDAHANGKEHDDDIQKSVSLDIHSSSSGAQIRKQGYKTENKDNGKSPVVTITGFRDLNAEFEEYYNNSSIGVNAASFLVSTAGQNSIHSTNDFSAAGLSNAAIPNLKDLSHDADDQNGIAERKNRTLIEADRTLLVDLLLPIPFWAEAVNTACYVQNRVLVTKPHNKTPYALLHGRLPSIGFMRPFGCPVTILNTLDPLGKFQGKVDKGFLVGYSVCSKAFRTMNYHPVLAENKSNPTAGFQVTEKAGEEGTQTYVLFLVLSDGSTNPKNNKDAHTVSAAGPLVSATGLDFTNNTNDFTATGPLVSAAELNFTNNTNDFSATGPSNAAMPNLEDLSHNADDVGVEADTNNMESVILVSPIPTTRIHKDHPTSQINGDLYSTTQTRSMARAVRDQGRISQMFNEDFHTCMFACFLSQEEPKRIHQALKDPSWIKAMQEELLLFKMQKVWILVDLPYGKRNGFQRGTIDQTLFIKKQQKDILLV
nr:putative ribonuclease H-like domain-containing protein [Tanacetum cinerariifolium]